MKRKIGSNLSIIALSSTLALTPLGNIHQNVEAKGSQSAEQILSNLDSTQRAALEKLTNNNITGLHLSSDVDVTSNELVSVIVQFKSDTPSVAVVKAKNEGKKLTKKQAEEEVNEEHVIFEKELKKFGEAKKSSNQAYEIKQSFSKAFNGVVIDIAANEVEGLLQSDVVKAIWSDEIVTVEPGIETESVIETSEENFSPYGALSKLHSENHKGDGVKVGILDTGIDYNHPDLQDAYKGGYDFVDMDDDPMETTYEDWQNSREPEFNANGSYYTEHGTHVAGIIGGRGTSESEYAVTGVAPNADIYAYRVLGPYGSGLSSGIIAAIEQSLIDGMDVINMSLGNSLNNPLYATSIAVNNAVVAGLTTVISAGNAGSEMFTLGSPGTSALALTVGASTVSIDLLQYQGTLNKQSFTLRELAKNYSDELSLLKNTSNELVSVGLGEPTDYEGIDVTGKIAFVQRGSFALIDKVKNAKANGAKGIIIANNMENEEEGPIQTLLGESTDAIPAFSVSYSEGIEMLSLIQDGISEFTFGGYSSTQTVEDELAAFSSRGPSRLNYDVKPEVVAPGVSILSTVPSYINSENGDYEVAYQRMSGTSMASPYVAGVVALLLEDNPSLTPGDVKSILMNTADPLSKEYSVYEIGSGRVDAYEAIYANKQFTIADSTTSLVEGKLELINEETGGISFGTISSPVKTIIEQKEINIQNNSDLATSFDISVQYNTDLRGSNNASDNGVILSADKSIKVKANGKKTTNVFLSIPKTAQVGTYEGYIVFTNKENPEEIYQIPFGFRIAEDKVNLDITKPMFSNRLIRPAQLFAYPFVNFDFSTSSYMKSLDVVLQDGESGEDLGLITSISTSYINENIVYPFSQAFNGTYYPFTNDETNPISTILEEAKPGHYKIKLVGETEQGKVISTSEDFLYEIAPPIMTTSFDDLEQKVIEYNENQLDENGQFLYDFTIHVDDPEIEEAGSYGIDTNNTQSAVVSYYNSAYPANPIYTDNFGDYKDQILVDSKIKYLPVSFLALDPALNGTSPFSVVFVKDSEPYYYMQTDTKVLKTGNTAHYSARANNIKDLKSTKFSLQVYDGAMLENINVSDEVTEYGEATIDIAKTSNASSSTYTITYNFNGEALPEDIELFTYDLSAIDTHSYESVILGNFSTSNINNNGIETKNVYTYVDRFDYQNTNSKVNGSIKFEGAKNPTTGANISTIDYRNIGAEVTFTSPDNQFTIDGQITSKTGGIVADGLVVSEDNYQVKVDAPGHFTIYDDLRVTDNLRGELYGSAANYVGIVATAGDTNKDNVIDILDAINVQEKWGSSDVSADFNFDKVVNKDDMYFVVKNFGMKNPTVLNAPTVTKEYNGKSLDKILAALNISF